MVAQVFLQLLAHCVWVFEDVPRLEDILFWLYGVELSDIRSDDGREVRLNALGLSQAPNTM